MKHYTPKQEALLIIKQYEKVLKNPILLLRVNKEDILASIERLQQTYILPFAQIKTKPDCSHINCRKNGIVKGKQRYFCKDCYKIFY